MSNIKNLQKKYGFIEDEENEEVTPLPLPRSQPSGLSNIDRLVREHIGSEVPVRTIITDDGSPQEIAKKTNFVDLDKIFDEYEDGAVIKEDILKDDRLMEVVYQNLEARNRPSTLVSGAYKGLSGLAGAESGGSMFGPRDYRKMDKEDVFEMWQNYQRSFAGGQTVTTANEVVYGMGADELTQSKLGAGYYLFDSMDNAFTGRGSTSEMFDAIGDYTKAGLYDPATFLSFGLGKALSFGATKASSVAARSLLIKGYQNYIKQGMTKTAARRAVGNIAAKAAPVTAADALIQVGVDIGYQNQLIETGVQNKYSVTQTAMAMGGAAFIPAVYAGTTAVKELRKSKILKNTFVGYAKLDKDILNLGLTEAKKKLAAIVDKDSININVKRNFKLQEKRNAKQFANWEAIKKEAIEGVAERGEEFTDTKPITLFMRRFMLGEPDTGKVGFRQSLVDSGWVVHESMLENNTRTGIYAEAVTDYLTDEVAKEAIEAFEKSTGKKLGIGYTAQAISQNFARGAHAAGQTNWIGSQLARLDNAGLKTEEALLDMASGRGTGPVVKKKKKGKFRSLGILGGKAEDEADVNRFGLSVYKRLLTSHLSTTGANLKGFGLLTSLNTASDFATAAINMTQSGFYKARGNAAQSEIYKNRAWGSALGAARRGISVLSPELEYEYALRVLEASPESRKKLFRDVAGDGGVQDGLANANLDPNNKLYKGADAVTKGAQTLTLVKMQDELTKTWAFGNNVNQQIMREYGVSPEVFFARADAAIEMAKPKFKVDVLEKATFRTLRETASVNWSTLDRQSGNAMRSAAKGIEFVTNKTGLGYLVPFGSFLNTTLASMGDLVGVNAIRSISKTAFGIEVDYATQEGAELLGKTIAGWTVIAGSTYAAGGAIDKIKEGLSWNQDRIGEGVVGTALGTVGDGTIEDKTYDWPESTIRLISHIIGHASGPEGNMNPFKWKYSEVPDDLKYTLAMQLGGQSVRDLKDFERSLWEYGTNLSKAFDGDKSAGQKALALSEALVTPPAMRIVQGLTRPVDPINFTYGLVSGANMTPDLKQGPENYAKGLRYVNNLFDGILGDSAPSGLEKKATPTRGFDQIIDPGKQLLGVRGDRENNYIESMLNSAGMSDWRTISFDGPPRVKNYMNAVATSYLNQAALKYLKRNPNFFKLPQAEKERVIQTVVKETTERVTSRMKTGRLPKTLEMVRVLSNRNDSKIKDIMDWMGIEGDVEDLIGTEDALSTLKKIQFYYDKYDRIFFGDLDIGKKN